MVYSPRKYQCKICAIHQEKYFIILIYINSMNWQKTIIEALKYSGMRLVKIIKKDTGRG